MPFRQVYIKTAKELRLEKNNLKIIKEETEILLPLEDINTILLEDNKTMISARLMTELSKYMISLVLCNEKYFPSTQVLPWNSYYNQMGTLKLQLSLNQKLKDNLWKKIIKQKIHNQKTVLEMTTENEYTINLLDNYYKEVKLNDVDNKEAISARVFFADMYGSDFNRFGSSSISSALNYGYSILHGAVVRNLVSIGFNTCLGIWHDSSKNAYNLASDLIEPFRPLVDLYIYYNIDRIDVPLPSSIRMDLINILNQNILLDNKICKVEYAISQSCQSLINTLEEKNHHLLKLPTIIENNYLDNE